MNEFMKFIGVLVIVTLSIIFGGYAFATLWDWFIVTKFGMPSLSIAESIGVGMVVSYATHQVNLKDKDRTASDLLTIGIVKPLAALGIGWVVLQFI